MRYTDAQYAKALYETVATSGVTETTVANFVRLLEKNRSRGRIHRIMRIFEKIYYEKKGVERVIITTARDLPKGALRLSEKVEVHTIIDKTLLGGLRIRVGDVEIDNSVKGSLEAIKRVLV